MEYHDLYGERKVCCNFLILLWKVFFSSVTFLVFRIDLYFPRINLINVVLLLPIHVAYCNVFMLMSLILPTRVYMFWFLELYRASVVDTCKSVLYSSRQNLCST